MARVAILVALLSAVFAPGAVAQPSRAFWFSGLVVTNPTASQVLLTTPGLAAGSYLIAVTIYNSQAITTVLQQVRGGNVLQTVIIPARATFSEYVAPLPLNLVASDTIRVLSRVAAVGEIQVVIYTQPTS